MADLTDQEKYISLLLSFGIEVGERKENGLFLTGPRDEDGYISINDALAFDSEGKFVKVGG